MTRVLAFGCHPDDIELMCGGTLALLAGAGCEIHMAIMAGGEMGSTQLPPEAIREKRLKEAEASAAVLGAKFYFAGGYDIEVDYNADYRRRTIAVMRQASPDIVLTSPPTDYLIDHEETSRLVRNAAFIASVPNYDCGHPTAPMKKIPHLYYWNASGLTDILGRPLPMTGAVDVSSVMETKTKMLACHDSQRQWLKFINGWDEYLETMRRTTAQQGQSLGLAAAEQFMQHLGSGHPQDNLLKALLGGRYHDIPQS